MTSVELARHHYAQLRNLRKKCSWDPSISLRRSHSKMPDKPLRKTDLEESEASTSATEANQTVSIEEASSTSSSIEVLAHLAIPELADYVIPFERFGFGAQGQIYRATKRNNDEKVIIKTVKINSFTVITRFIQEYKALLLLQNKENFVKILNYFYNMKFTYLIMDYIDGATISQLSIIRRMFSCQAILETLRQLCVALDIIHSAAIIHRDISPDNVMIDRNGVLKLIDFGLCRVMSAKTAYVTQDIGWYSDYSPPEMDKAVPYNYKVDLYSSALTIGSMLSSWIPEHLMNLVRTLVQDHAAGQLPLAEIIESLRIKRLDERALVILESWLKFEPEDRVESSVWLTNNHFLTPLEKKLYIIEIFEDV